MGHCQGPGPLLSTPTAAAMEQQRPDGASVCARLLRGCYDTAWPAERWHASYTIGSARHQLGVDGRAAQLNSDAAGLAHSLPPGDMQVQAGLVDVVLKHRANIYAMQVCTPAHI